MPKTADLIKKGDSHIVNFKHKKFIIYKGRMIRSGKIISYQSNK